MPGKLWCVVLGGGLNVKKAWHAVSFSIMIPGCRILHHGSGTYSTIIVCNSWSNNTSIFWFLRPVLGKRRLPPDEFATHCITHKFRNLCCLCAASTGRYTESIMSMDLSGPQVGEYVARCSTDTCGYFSIPVFISSSPTPTGYWQHCFVVCMEPMYVKRGLCVRWYSTWHSMLLYNCQLNIDSRTN